MQKMSSQLAEHKSDIHELCRSFDIAQERVNRREQIYRDKFKDAIKHTRTLPGRIKRACGQSTEIAKVFGFVDGKFDSDDEEMTPVDVKAQELALPAELILKRKHVAFIDGEGGPADGLVPVKRVPHSPGMYS